VAGRGSVVVTGASRGLGLATAAHLHRRGWTVVCAVRTPDVALERLREATGATGGDPRLVAVRLDLDDPASIESAARDITVAVGAPDAVVHNAGVAARALGLPRPGSLRGDPVDPVRPVPVPVPAPAPAAGPRPDGSNGGETRG
jgi:NAD(P)-dependent dehydrogenase (short-subunit alcohol dehydrogenase family)